MPQLPHIFSLCEVYRGTCHREAQQMYLRVRVYVGIIMNTGSIC